MFKKVSYALGALALAVVLAGAPQARAQQTPISRVLELVDDGGLVVCVALAQGICELAATTPEMVSLEVTLESQLGVEDSTILGPEIAQGCAEIPSLSCESLDVLDTRVLMSFGWDTCGPLSLDAPQVDATSTVRFRGHALGPTTLVTVPGPPCPLPDRLVIRLVD